MDFIDQLSQRPRLRKTLIWALALAVGLALLLIALPIVATHYAEGWLRDNGASAAHIDDIDINLFTGVVQITGLQASNGPRERLRVGAAELGVRWWPLVTKRIHVDFLKLADTQIDVAATDAGAWQIGAVTIEPAEPVDDPAPVEPEVVEAEGSTWGFGSDAIALNDVQLTYRDALIDKTVDIRELLVGSHFSWDAGRKSDLKIDMSIDGSPLVIDSNISAWSEQRQFSGALELNDLKLADYGQVLSEIAGLVNPRGAINFDLQMNAMLNADGSLQIGIRGPVEVLNAGFALDGTEISNGSLRWQGEIGVVLPVPEVGSLLKVEGELQLTDTRVSLGDLELTTSLDTFGWQGLIEFSPARSEDTSLALGVQSDLSGSGLTLEHARLPFVLAALDKIDATSLAVKGLQQASIQQLQLHGLQLISSPEGDAQVADVFTLELLDLASLDIDAQQGLAAQSLVLMAPRASLVRDEQGEFERISEVIAVFTDTGEMNAEQSDDIAPEQQTESAAPLTIMVTEVRLQSDKLLQFEDRSVDPTATFTLTQTDLNIKHLDSAGDKPMDLIFETGDGNMKFNAKGDVNAFAEALSANLTLQLSALNLPQISAYAPGYNIERGRLGADSILVLNDGLVDMQNTVTIDRLKLTGKAAEGSAPLAQGMAMPVDVALDLLRDSDDRISLKLPVSGSLTDPQFGTGDIIRQATQSALQNAAMSYVKSALQPLGTIMLVGNLAAKAARPRFEPVAMLPGEASFSGTGREYLQKLGGLLTERPGLRLTICSVATPADREALMDKALADVAEVTAAAASPDAATEKNDPAALTTPASGPVIAEVSDVELLALAETRTSTVINFLVSEAGIDQARLFSCRETIETADEDVPRTEITL